jgi:hypothetical protein
MEEKRVGTIPCEICLKNPVTRVKGGRINGKNGLWMCCNECFLKIEDKRKEVR